MQLTDWALFDELTYRSSVTKEQVKSSFTKQLGKSVKYFIRSYLLGFSVHHKIFTS